MRYIHRSDYSHANFTAFSKIMKKYFFGETIDVTATYIKLYKCELLHSGDCGDPHVIFEKLQQHNDQCTNQLIHKFHEKFVIFKNVRETPLQCIGFLLPITYYLKGFPHKFFFFSIRIIHSLK